MTSSYAIRSAGPDDLPELLRLFRGFMDYLGDPSPPEPELAGAILPMFQDETAALFLGGRAGEPPAAYAHVRTYYSVWMAAPECFLEDLFVSEAERGRGLGRAMLEAIFAWARERGCRRVRLDTNEENAAGRHLYEALDFTNQRDSYDGARQLYYTKNL